MWFWQCHPQRLFLADKGCMKKSEVWNYVPKHSAVLMSCFAMKKVKSLSGAWGLPLPTTFFFCPEVYVDITMKAAKEMLGCKSLDEKVMFGSRGFPSRTISIATRNPNFPLLFLGAWLRMLPLDLPWSWHHKWIGSRKFKHFNLWEALSLSLSLFLSIYIHIY